MKIIQLVTGQDDGGHVLLGLSDDGSLYEFCYRQEPRVVGAHRKSRRDTVSGDFIDTEIPATYHDGNTQGWRLLCPPGITARAVPHKDDPTRCERC